MAGWPALFDEPGKFEKALREALGRTHGDFMNLPGVTGYGLAQQGDNPQGEYIVKVFVRDKVGREKLLASGRLPSEIELCPCDGCVMDLPVEIEEIGEVTLDVLK